VVFATCDSTILVFSIFNPSDALYEHCKKHETCFLCSRAGIRHEYHENYSELEKHFRKDHHVCEDRECLEKKFVVFGSEIDLRGHQVFFYFYDEAEEHRGNSTRGVQLDLQFNYARSEPPPSASSRSKGKGAVRSQLSQPERASTPPTRSQPERASTPPVDLFPSLGGGPLRRFVLSTVILLFSNRLVGVSSHRTVVNSLRRREVEMMAGKRIKERDS
jgi:hypothetical protein